jgi:uncharacterized protein (TIGR03435 family)
MRKTAILFALAAAFAQTPTAFEAASVKVSGPDSRPESGGGPGTASPGQYHRTSARLLILLMQAYDVQDYQLISKTPLDRGRYDLMAKVPPGATREQFRTMLQNLLAERFHLKLHRESRIMPAWEMTVAKGGPKLKESQTGGEPPAGDPPPKKIGADEFPRLPPGQPAIAGFYSLSDGVPVGHIAAQQQPVSALAREKFADRNALPIVDHTGLTGLYDFHLAFMVGSPGGADDVKAPPLPDLFTAFKEQLGLQLTPKKLPIDVLVIESFDASPIEN